MSKITLLNYMPPPTGTNLNNENSYTTKCVFVSHLRHTCTLLIPTAARTGVLRQRDT